MGILAVRTSLQCVSILFCRHLEAEWPGVWANKKICLATTGHFPIVHLQVHSTCPTPKSLPQEQAKGEMFWRFRRTEEKARQARSASHPRGKESENKISPYTYYCSSCSAPNSSSHPNSPPDPFPRAWLALRALLAFTSVRLKYAKRDVCAADTSYFLGKE